MHSRCEKTLGRMKWKRLVVIGIFIGKLSKETISNEIVENVVGLAIKTKKEKET